MRASRRVQWAATLAWPGCWPRVAAPREATPEQRRSLSAGSVPDKPSKAVTLNILDVAGNKQLTGDIFDQFAQDHPDVISSVTWETAGAPDMAGKVKAQQQAGNLKIDLVLTGTDGLAAGISESLFAPVAKDYKDRLGNMANYQAPAAEMQKLAQDQAVELTYYPSGPLLEYNPAKVPNPPTTAEELLAWAKAHPGHASVRPPGQLRPRPHVPDGPALHPRRLRPEGPGQRLDQDLGLPQAAQPDVSSYPTGTGVTMNNLKNGTWDMALTTTGWDINPRPGPGPENFKRPALKGFTWVTDAQYAAVPKGVSADKMSAILQVLQYALTPTAGQDVRHRLLLPRARPSRTSPRPAPQDSQDVIKKFGRPEYDAHDQGQPQGHAH